MNDPGRTRSEEYILSEGFKYYPPFSPLTFSLSSCATGTSLLHLQNSIMSLSIVYNSVEEYPTFLPGGSVDGYIELISPDKEQDIGSIDLRVSGVRSF